MVAAAFIRLMERIDKGNSGVKSKSFIIISTMGYIAGMLFYLLFSLGVSHAVPKSVFNFGFLVVPVVIYAGLKNKFSIL